jgi:hypothetical protein
MDPTTRSGEFPSNLSDEESSAGSEKGNKGQSTKEKKGLDTVTSLKSFVSALDDMNNNKAKIGESGGRKFTYGGVEYSMNDIVKCYLRLVEDSNLTDITQRDLTIQVMKKLRQVNEGNQLKTDNLSIGKSILLSVKQLGGKEIDKLESKLKSAIKKGVNGHSSWSNRREELINDMTTRISVVNQQKVNMSMDQKFIKELGKMRENKSFSNLKMPEIRDFFKQTESFFKEDDLRGKYQDALVNRDENPDPLEAVRTIQINQHEKYMKGIQKALDSRIEARTAKKKADFAKENPTKTMSSSELDAINKKEAKDKEKVKSLLANKTQLYKVYLDKLEASVKLDSLEKDKGILNLKEDDDDAGLLEKDVDASLLEKEGDASLLEKDVEVENDD